MKKELRFTKKYKCAYFLIFILSKLFFWFNIPKFSIYFREINSIFRAGMWSILCKQIGFGSKIDSGFSLRYKPNMVSIGKYSHIDINTTFEVYKELIIGDYVHICPNVYIQSGDMVKIEDYACLSNGVKIYSKSNTYGEKMKFVSMSSNAPVEYQKFKSGKVHIKKNAFVGVNSVILPNVTIGENSIVGAGSVVNKDIPPNTIAAGVPVKIIKKLK